MRNIIPAIIAVIVFKLIMMVLEVANLQNAFWIVTTFWLMLILTIVAFTVAKIVQNRLI